MKQKIASILAMCLTFGTMANFNVLAADPTYKIAFANPTVAQGEEAILNVSFPQMDGCQGLEFVVTLPTGLTFNTEKVTKAYLGGADFKPADSYDVNNSAVYDDQVKIVWINGEGKGQALPAVTIPLAVKASATELGEKTITVDTADFQPTGTLAASADSNLKVTITKAPPAAPAAPTVTALPVNAGETTASIKISGLVTGNEYAVVEGDGTTEPTAADIKKADATEVTVADLKQSTQYTVFTRVPANNTENTPASAWTKASVTTLADKDPYTDLAPTTLEVEVGTSKAIGATTAPAAPSFTYKEVATMDGYSVADDGTVTVADFNTIKALTGYQVKVTAEGGADNRATEWIVGVTATLPTITAKGGDKEITLPFKPAGVTVTGGTYDATTGVITFEKPLEANKPVSIQLTGTAGASTTLNVTVGAAPSSGVVSGSGSSYYESGTKRGSGAGGGSAMTDTTKLVPLRPATTTPEAPAATVVPVQPMKTPAATGRF